MTAKIDTPAREAKLAKRKSDDLRPRDCIALAIRSAFPLPESGAFADLLAAIDARER